MILEKGRITVSILDEKIRAKGAKNDMPKSHSSLIEAELAASTLHIIVF